MSHVDENDWLVMYEEYHAKSPRYQEHLKEYLKVCIDNELDNQEIDKTSEYMKVDSNSDEFFVSLLHEIYP